MLPIHKAEVAIKRVLTEISSDSHNIFTPFALCNEVLDKIPSLEGKILVVSNLEFVYTIVYRGVNTENVYFATPCPVKKEMATAWIPEQNVFMYKTIITKEDVGNMKFDVVVGNPPYQFEGNGTKTNMYDKFYYATVPLATRYVAFVTPTAWLKSKKGNLSKVRAFIETNGLTDVYELNASKVFGVKIDMLGYTIQDVNSTSDSYVYHTNDGQPIVCSKGELPLLHPNPLVRSIILKMVGVGVSLGAFNTEIYSVGKNGCHNGDSSKEKTSDHTIPMINKVSGGNIEYAWTRRTKRNHADKTRVMFGYLSSDKSLGEITVYTHSKYTTSRMVTYIPVNNETEGESLKSFLQSKMFRFVLPVIRYGTTNTPGLLNLFHRPRDLSRSWTDAELYEHFNLTQEEIDLIESTIK